MNYRPISLLPSISKILEKIVYKRLYSFLNKNNLIIPNQYGFRENHSTDYAISQLYDKITDSLSKKEHNCRGLYGFIQGIRYNGSPYIDL